MAKANKRVVHITDITWDTDGEDISTLPTDVIVNENEIPPSVLCESGERFHEELSDFLSDYLSDNYGFCHKGFLFHIE